MHLQIFTLAFCDFFLTQISDGYFLCCMLLQIIELPAHPYFVGVQFHPEFKSRPGQPSALFSGNASFQMLQLFVMQYACSQIVQPTES